MTADAGLAQISARFAAQARAGVAEPDPVGGDPLARLVMALDGSAKATRDQTARLLARARACQPIPLPPMVYTVTAAGALAPGTGFGGAAATGPRTGYFWDVTRVSLEGLVGSTGTTLAASGTVTDPGAAATIANIALGSLSPGDWLIQVTVGLEGTVTAADANNMRLRVNAVNLETYEYPGVVGLYPMPAQTVQIPAGFTSGITVQTVGAASGAAAIYTAQITATQQLPGDEVRLYKQRGALASAGAHTFTASGGATGPDWHPGKGACVMRDGDSLNLVAVSPLAATAVVLSGEAIQIEAAWIGDYFL